MRAHQEVDVFDGDGALRHAAPWNVVGIRRIACGRRIPIFAGVQVALHVPGARGVIDVVFCSGRAESGSRIEMIASQGHAAADDAIGRSCWLKAETVGRSRIDRTIEMVCGHEFAQIRTAHEFALVAEGVVEVEIIDAELVGNGRIAVVRYTAGDPMVAAYRLDIPDFIHVGDDDAVRLVGAVCREQFRKARNACSRGVHVWQD